LSVFFFFFCFSILTSHETSSSGRKRASTTGSVSDNWVMATPKVLKKIVKTKDKKKSTSKKNAKVPKFVSGK